MRELPEYWSARPPCGSSGADDAASGPSSSVTSASTAPAKLPPRPPALTLALPKRNQQILNGVLAGITTKLQLLGSQTECPICLEHFSEEDRPPTTLSCAHKACQECWGHWVAVNSRRTAVCPLCRHEEFLDGVLRAASVVSPPDVSD